MSTQKWTNPDPDLVALHSDLVELRGEVAPALRKIDQTLEVVQRRLMDRPPRS